jgi:uncharacterized protein (TIGR04255 family)
VISSTNYEIREISPKDPPQITRRDVTLDHVRARNDDETFWVQLADDQLLFNVARGSGEYPGFEHLLCQALAKLDDYVNFFFPTGVKQCELHYVDIIEIPMPPERQIEMEDYFHLRIDVPKDFPMMIYNALRVFLRPPVAGDMLEVQLQSEPQMPDTNSFRFRMDWHMVCANIGTLDVAIISERLREAHRFILKTFESSFTPKTWAIFEPVESE